MTSPDAPDSPEPDAADLQGLRVLVVEDSRSVAIAVKNLLRSFGAEVIGPVATMAEAVGLIAEGVPDVALVDINLRGGELAYDLIDRLHALGVRIVVTSGDPEIPLAAGKAVAVLEKPVSEASLIASLRPAKVR
jgi:CheY-like chemotaxis protein